MTDDRDRTMSDRTMAQRRSEDDAVKIAAAKLSGNPLFRCDNCRQLYANEDELDTIHRYYERVTSAVFIPVGECPLCGSLVYEVEL